MTLVEPLIDQYRVVARAALTAALAAGTPAETTRAHSLPLDKADMLAFVVHYSSVLCAPENIKAAVDEIDCCPGCEHTSSSGSTCYKSERGEYCPFEVAETLRQIGFALYGPHPPSHYTPRSLSSPTRDTAAAGQPND
jgi:hypothetical protein